MTDQTTSPARPANVTRIQGVDLAPIWDRFVAATPGPWHHTIAQVDGIPGRHEAVLVNGAEPRVIAMTGFAGAHSRSGPDAEFIAHARVDVGRLLAALLKVHGRMSKVEAAAADLLSELRDSDNDELDEFRDAMDRLGHALAPHRLGGGR